MRLNACTWRGLNLFTISCARAEFFVRRFANMHWAILTPDACALWDKQSLHMLPGATADQASAPDAEEALWLTYYQFTFNPARLKEQAMLKEMPRRYWKNLPEAQLISGLVANARSRTASMLASLESLDAPNDQ